MKRIKKILLSIALLPFILTSCNNESDSQIGPFEITAMQRELAKTNSKNYSVLDAGRGNPNWINTQARYAYNRFEEYALSECELTYKDESMAGQAQLEGIGNRFDEFMNYENKVDKFLIDSISYCVNELKLNKDEIIKEFVDGIIGCYYPSPSRCLINTEKILNKYIETTLFNGVNLSTKTQVFPTEGGSAAICYIFNSLSHNRLLNKGDKIAIATPIFTPYLEIPHINDYGLVSINVDSTSETNWEISDAEIKKLENNNVKAFFLVNPSNPASHALSTNTLNKIKKVIEKNPNLIIITDDVYGTFVNNFQTLYSVAPENTMLVYSFSKLYGVTGWRLGLIALNETNIFDEMLKGLSSKDKKYLDQEYSSVTDDVPNFPFIERIVADSRSIGLYHTSGLSTPSQIFMDFLALTHLLNVENDEYINKTNEIINERYDALMNALNLAKDEDVNNAKYYCLLDLKNMFKVRYSEEFKTYITSKYTLLDILNDLASIEGVVVMYGPGFDAPDWSIRISLANLNKDQYIELARRIYELFDEYFEKYQTSNINNLNISLLLNYA